MRELLEGWDGYVPANQVPILIKDGQRAGDIILLYSSSLKYSKRIEVPKRPTFHIEDFENESLDTLTDNSDLYTVRKARAEEWNQPHPAKEGHVLLVLLVAELVST